MVDDAGTRPMADDERYQRAKARVAQLRGFYTHAAVYVVVNTALLILNLLTSPGYFWFLFPALGWGIGLAAHAVTVYGIAGRWGPEWEERKIRELMERDRTS